MRLAWSGGYLVGAYDDSQSSSPSSSNACAAAAYSSYSAFLDAWSHTQACKITAVLGIPRTTNAVPFAKQLVAHLTAFLYLARLLPGTARLLLRALFLSVLLLVICSSALGPGCGCCCCRIRHVLGGLVFHCSTFCSFPVCDASMQLLYVDMCTYT